MNTIITLLVLATALIASKGIEPQVYEDLLDEIQSFSKENVRITRDPSSQIKVNHQKFPEFNYHNTAQQDQRHYRYAQQQQADLKNILRRNNYQTKKPSQLLLSLKETTQNNDVVLDQTISSSNLELRRTPNRTRKTRARRIQKIFNLQNDSKIQTDRQDQVAADSQIVYVHPNAIRAQFNVDQNVARGELSALNALLGQNPNNQLEGLKKLLSTPPANYILPVIKSARPFQSKDHTPIEEQTVDIPNPQMKPNVKIEHNIKQDATLQAIQAQLDAASKAEASKVLAQAHQEAAAQVQAQHQAIANAKAQAQEEALKKIAAQNKAFAKNQLFDSPIALPLQAEALPVRQNYASNIPSVLRTEAVPREEIYAPSHNHQSIALLQAERALFAQLQPQNGAIVKAQARQQAREQVEKAVLQAQKEAQRASLKKISITKTHSITQGHHTPSNFQEVVLETRHREDVQPVADFSGEQEKHQYASRYAFGYRIKDVKMGNDFGHEEKRDGKSAKGHYHVLLPDGRLQKVEYYADPTGYHAKVTYENVAHH